MNVRFTSPPLRQKRAPGHFRWGDPRVGEGRTERFSERYVKKGVKGLWRLLRKF